MQQLGTRAIAQRVDDCTRAPFVGQQQPLMTPPADRAVSPASAPSTGFSRDRRVRRRGEFTAIFDGGTRLHSRYFTFLLLGHGRAACRLGIVASKKIGGAVQRNRAKRLIREMFRQQIGQQGTAGFDLVIIPRREVLDVAFETLQQDFRQIWRRGVERLAAPRRG